MGIHELWINKTEPEMDPGFYNEYIEKEMAAYAAILSEGSGEIKGTCREIADKFDMDLAVLAGFLDGVNSSLEEKLDLDTLEEDTPLDIKIDFEKLLYNMHAAKANWLYHMKEWENVFTAEKRDEIKKKFHDDHRAVSNKVGRNDPCPCGSGKKYKKCCGK